MNRRESLVALGALGAGLSASKSAYTEVFHTVPPDTALTPSSVPTGIRAGGGYRVLQDEAQRRTIGTVFDRLIPADGRGPSATQAGCLEFLDDQLAGDFGSGAALYLKRPFEPGIEADLMGSPQTIATPRQRYEAGVKALMAYAEKTDHAHFWDLSATRVDQIVTDMEAGKLDLGDGVDAKALFELMLQNAREGYLADPIYGGNKDMAGWKMVGFPGARYDYRPYVDRRGEDLGIVPVSLIPAS